ncbi:YgaP family membrane protein [Falsiroseomonas sp. CW058]|uniref:YgaP family membrane protein n=1 Tax=Falsiroseomonas sp. CW058 TaxID=3388664 RepID=UPI003D31EE51
MASNVGGIDRTLRVVAGVVLLALGAFGPLGWWGLVGLVPLATGLAGTCPAYALLGLSTCPLARKA